MRNAKHRNFFDNILIAARANQSRMSSQIVLQPTLWRKRGELFHNFFEESGAFSSQYNATSKFISTCYGIRDEEGFALQNMQDGTICQPTTQQTEVSKYWRKSSRIRSTEDYIGLRTLILGGFDTGWVA